MQPNRVLRSVLFGTCVLAVASCSSGGSGSNQSGISQRADVEKANVTAVHLSLDDAPDTEKVVTASRELGLDVLQALPGQTVVASPASAVVALSMLASGASGEAESQFTKLLGAGGQQRDEAVNALIGSLEQYRTDVKNIDPTSLPEEPQVHMTSQIVISELAQINEDYLVSLAKWYDAGATVTDLSTKQGKRLLDEWVNINTAGLVKESAIEPSPTLRLVLQNAVVLAAQWQDTFDASATYPQTFTPSGGGGIETDFVHDIRDVPYAKVDGWQMAELAYGSEGSLVARLIVPPKGTDPATITSELVADLEKELKQELLSLSIPKLDLASSAELTDILKDAGLTSVFTPGSLDYISSAEDLFVSAVIQQGRLRLDEEGTVAAAVTEIAVEASGAMTDPPIEFDADRPFLLFIQDKSTGWDLFQVMINQPSTD